MRTLVFAVLTATFQVMAADPLLGLPIFDHVARIRADTVVLQFVDAHTVVSIYKRARKVAAQDMTATSDGTQMNGVRIHDDLVFEKQ
jgi:hypothetical protein